MVTARGFAAKNRYEIDPNQEFVALGVSDLGAGVLGGFAVSGADSRTAVNDAMGGRSPLTSLVAAAALAATLVFLTGPLGGLPMAVLSAVLIKAAMGLLDLRGLVHLRRVSRREFLLSVTALLGVATIGVLPGVVLAIGLALVQLIAAASSPHDAVLGRDPGTGEYVDVTQHAGAESVPGLVLYRFDAALLFFNADHFKARVRAVMRGAPGAVRGLVLDAGTIPQLDSTGAACLDDVRDELESKGVALVVAAARSPIRGMLERTGLAAKLGPGRMFPTVGLAVEALRAERPGGAPAAGPARLSG
jgi:MFS superfamily sulfate permease-like transporter